MIVERSYIGTDDEIVLTCRYGNDVYNDEMVKVASAGDLIPFKSNAVTEMKLYINDRVVTDPKYISFVDGRIKLRLGTLEGIYPDRDYPISILAVDSSHPNGQTIIDPSRPTASVEVEVKNVNGN